MSAPSSTPSQPQEPAQDFGEAAGTPGFLLRRGPGTKPVDLTEKHWEFQLKVLRIFVYFFVIFQFLNYIAAFFEIKNVVEFKDFAQYVIPIFAFLLGIGIRR